MLASLPHKLHFPFRLSAPRPMVGLILGSLILGSATYTVFAQVNTNDSCPNEEPITVPDVEQKYIQTGISRPGTCITPDMIFMHATEGGSLDSNWDLFNNGGQNQNGTNAHFIIGQDGQILQTVPLYQEKVEFAKTNTPMNDRTIGIEMVNPTIDFEGGKSGMPLEQYNAALKLVCYLMGQYSIPLGTNEADWVSERNFWAEDPAWSPGVYGHYQIGRPPVHQDPGKQWLTDFRADLKSGKCSVATNSTGGSGGRIVPYDAFARPYSWPTTGVIKQPYGFTEEAQSLGARYPGYYPLGDPSAIFSTTNHDEPPIDPATAKYINPNIDIAPANNTASARAVYATQAGWITYAGWAGPEKGYSIQIESDVEGDGQADLATRYMRLQAPQDGYFAPDIAEYYPETTPITNPTEQDPESTEQHTPPPFVLEGEHMQTQSPDLAVVDTSDPTASSGASMRLQGQTAIRQQDVEHKADQLMIKAKMTKNIACADGAKMEVLVNNQVIDTITVNSTIWQTYPLTVDGLDGSSHTITIRFANPSLLLCQRQLWVDSIYYVITNPNTPTVETVASSRVEAEDLPDATQGDKHAEVKNDTVASQGKYVAFTSNSTIEGEVELTDSNYFSIRARADLCGEEVPILSFKVDGNEVIALGVNQEDWTEYSYTFKPGQSVTASSSTEPSTDNGSTAPPPSQSGPTVQGATTQGGNVLQAADEQAPQATTYKISLEFTNDHYQSPLCDRNVYVDVLTFKTFAVTQAIYSKTSLIGKTKYVAFNQLIGYVSSSRGTDVEWEQYVESNAIDYSQINPGGDGSQAAEQEKLDRETFISRVPNTQQTYLSYRIMYNNPNMTTFPPPTEVDRYINAKVDNPYIVETEDNKVAGSLKTAYDEPESPMFFFCALRQRGDNVKCIFEPNP